MSKPKIKIGNVWSRIENLPDDARETLYEKLSYTVPGAFFVMRSGSYGKWDGKKRLVRKVRGKNELDIHSGVVARTIKLLYNSHNIEVELADERVKPEKTLNYQWNKEAFPLRDYQKNVVKDSIQKTRGVIEVATGGGKCCNKDTVCITEEGMLPIGYFDKKNLNPECHNDIKLKVKTDKGSDVANKIYYDGSSIQSKKITTKCGYNICGTKSHKVKILDNNLNVVWKKLSEIKKGDVAVIYRGKGMFGKSKKIDEDTAYYLGLIFGDGGLNNKNNVTLTNGDDHILNFIREYYKKRKISFREELNSKKSINIISKKPHRDFLRENYNIEYSLSTNKEWPIDILKSKKNIVASFIRGLYESDGWVENKPSIHIGLNNERFIKNLQCILLNFGIISSIRVKKNNKKDNFVLSIYRSNLEKFMKEIGLDKRGRKHKYINKHIYKNINKNKKKNENLFFDKIDKIENVESENYDFEIPKTKTFIGNGFINHNTIIAAKLIQEIGVAPFLFYVMTKELLYQAKERLEAAIQGLEVGIIGDGKCEIKDVNVITVQTATRIYGNDIVKEIKETGKVCDFDDSTVQSMKKEDLSHLEKEEKRKQVKTLVESTKGIYFDECLLRDTKVIDKNGIPINIQDIRDGDRVFVGGNVSGFFSKNVKKVVKIKHQINELITTTTHPNMAIRFKSRKKDNKRNCFYEFKEKDLKIITSRNLKKNDYLLMPSKIDHFVEKKEDNNLSFNQLRLISMIMCDGHIEKYGYRVKINVDKDRKWFEDSFFSGLKDFGLENKGKSKIDNRGNLLLQITDKKFNNFLVNIAGIPRGKKSEKININKYIWNNKLDSLKGFVDGFFCSEGDVSKNRITFSSNSKEGINSLQTLLLKFGIKTTIRIKERKNKNYFLSVCGLSLDKYLDKIGISMSRKKIEMSEMLKNRKNTLREEKVKYKGKEYFVSKIKNIEIINGDFEVFDFTTNSHLFVANNTLTHNCHHCPSNTAKNVLTKSKKAYYLYGGSATPIRADKADIMIEGLFGRKTCVIDASFLIKKRYLMKPKIYYVKLTKKPNRVLNFADDMKKNIIENEERNNHIVSIAQKLANDGLSVLVLVGRIDHGKTLQSRIPESKFIYGTHSTKKRKQVLKELEEKKINILISSTIADEGLDIPTLNCVILAGGGKSPTKCKQRVGRAIRKTPDKEVSMIFDFMDIGKYTRKHSVSRKSILKKEKEFIISEIDSFESDKKYHKSKELF